MGPLSSAIVVSGILSLEGAGSCPSAADVAVLLEPLVPAASARAARIVLGELDGALRIRHYDAAGEVVHERLLQGGGCSMLALGAAGVIAGWVSEPAFAASASSLSLTSPTMAQGGPLGVARRSSALAVALGVAVAVSVVPDGGVAAGAQGEVVVAQSRSCWAGRVAIAGSGTREVMLPPGRVHWTRALAAVGPLCRLDMSVLTLTLHAEALAALVALRGDGFRTNYDAVDIDAGLGAGVRGALRWDGLSPFVDVGVAAWLTRRLVRADAGVAELPHVELMVSVGVTVPLP